MYIQMDTTRKAKRHCFAFVDHLPTANSTDSNVSAAASERQLSENNVNVLASRLLSSASEVARESEMLTGLISEIGQRINHYKQMLASIKSTAQEIVYVSEMLDVVQKEEENNSCNNIPQLDATPCRTNSVHGYPRYTTASPQTSGQSSLQAPTIIPILPGSSRTMHLPAISNLIPQKHLSGKIVKTKPAIPAAKRPLSDFNFFCRDARKLVVEAHPEYTKEQVNKELGRIWSMLDSSSRQHYRRMYVQDKQRYSSDVAAMDASMSGATLKSGIHHTVPVAPVAASTQSSYRNSNPNFGDIDIAHNTSPGRCSTSNRVKSIIWKHAKETISEEDPSKLSSLTSVPIPIVASETNTGGHSQSSVTDLLHIDETSCNYSINQATHSRGNTIESILNEVCNLERLGNTGESDDHDEPLAHSLVSNGGRCSIYAVQEHRLRETISAPAGSIKSKN